MPTLDWIGKAAVVNHHQEVPYRLLHCDKEHSVGASGEGNLLIQGDNLQALKALLPYYAGQVKCIYIDPPYNTGNEFWVYNDNVKAPEIARWLGEVVGKEAEDLSRHDKWLCMMYPRLNLLRDFLKDDGLIFVSIDENEIANLRLLMNEVFGGGNLVSEIIWKKSYGGGSKANFVVGLHEYVLCYARRKERIGRLELPPSPDARKYYKYQDDKVDSRGPYRTQPLATTSMDDRPNLRFPIVYKGEEIWPEKQWQWSQDRVEKALERDELVITRQKGKWSVNYKQYLYDEEGNERGAKPFSVLEGPYTQHGTQEIKAIFGDGKAFSFPKPSALVKQLLGYVWQDKDAIFLDSFAGSGTTGHAVLQLNKEDGGTRRFILTEMEPQIAESVTAERLRRVICGYGDTPGLGGGFRYCKLSEPLFNAQGQINETVTFSDLAHHIYFTETGEPLPQRPESDNSFIGSVNGVGYYLLWKGKDKEALLDNAALRKLPRHDGVRIVYADGCRVSPGRLKTAGVTFKQVPYEVRIN